MTFEQTGIDYLFVDEAHGYKNTPRLVPHPRRRGAGSQRADDLDSKLWCLRGRTGRGSPRFATATPIANAMAEMWVMQSLPAAPTCSQRRSRALRRVGRDLRVARSPRSSSPPTAARTGSRPASPGSATSPSSSGLSRQVADVRTADDLDLPVPALRRRPGGDDRGRGLRRARRPTSPTLVERAEAIRNGRVDPTEDNMLKITRRRPQGRARPPPRRSRAAPPAGRSTWPPQRIAATCEADRRQPATVDDSGEPSAAPGALQLVFCDLGTPHDRGRRASTSDLRDASSPRRACPATGSGSSTRPRPSRAKAELFAGLPRRARLRARSASTEKMGVGTNVQTARRRAPPPRLPVAARRPRTARRPHPPPGQPEPRGRILRYVTEGSFDVYMWQTVERKATFIAQVIVRRPSTRREIDDIGDQALSYAEVKALATGNPLIMEKAAVDAEVARLARLERAHHDDQHRLRRTFDTATHRAERAEQRATDLDAVIGRVTDTRGDRFTMTMTAHRTRSASTPESDLQRLLQRQLDQTPPETSGPTIRIGTLGGLALTAQAVTTIEDESPRGDPRCPRRSHLPRRNRPEA